MARHKNNDDMQSIISPLIFGIGTPELVLIAFVFLLLFGARKIPELMKGLGKGVKSFKDGMNGTLDDTDTPAEQAKKDETPKEQAQQ